MRRGAAVLLLLAVVACHARKEQPQALYDEGWAALLRGDDAAAQQIARDGETRFAAQPRWRELFAVLEAEAVVRKPDTRDAALAILARTPVTDEPRAAVRRLIVRAATQGAKDANETLSQADALAARSVPELRPEIRALRELRLGLLEESPSKAIGHYTLAAKYGHAAHATRAELSALNMTGWSYLLIGDLERAKAYFTLVADQDAFPQHQHTALVQLSEIFLRRLEFDHALPYARRALAVAEKLGTAKELANCYQQIGQIEFELGHFPEAAYWTDRAEKTRPGDDCVGVVSDVFTDARLLAATGNPARALSLLEAIVHSPHSSASRRWWAQSIEAEIYERLGRFAEAAQKFEETLTTAANEREKVEGTSALAFERNVLGVYEGYIRLLLLDEHDARRALQVAERSRARTLRDAINLGDANDVDPVALARRKNATILFYWLGAKCSFLWTVTPRGIEVAQLPADDVIDKATDDYRKELLSARHKLEVSKLGPKLYQMLVAPAGAIPPGSRVIIFPDAHLRALSFDALIVPATPKHYWIEDVTISYSPSLNLLASMPAWKRLRDPRALVFGNVPAEGTQFPELRRAGREIGEVARHFGARAVIRSGTDATPAAYAAADPRQFQFIHFATHATAGIDRPIEESKVILAPGAHGFSLSGADIVRVPLEAELVTVSSCNSAGRRNYAGEGLVGLAWAFLRAGARRVVAAQWEVDDSAAPPMMNEMYAAIVADGIEPAEALRRAKLVLLHSGTPHKQPVYWAPFAIYGAL